MVDRRTWFLAPGGVPFTAAARPVPPGAVWWCREGDAEWRVLADATSHAAARADRPAARTEARLFPPAEG